MVENAISKGTPFFDPKNGKINFILKDSFAIGKSLLVGMNSKTGTITTVIKGNNLLKRRFIPIK